VSIDFFMFQKTGGHDDGESGLDAVIGHCPDWVATAMEEGRLLMSFFL
jgi:hypothetical protein